MAGSTANDKSELEQVEAVGSKMENGVAARKSKEILHKASPKNGIPPKRAVTAADRKGTPTTPIASRQTESSMTRNVPKGSLSKASSRPLSTADRGRTHSTVTASTTPTLGRKSRNAVTSVDDPTKQRPDALTSTIGDVDHKPLSSERAKSTSPVKFLLRSSSKRSTPASSKRDPSGTGSTRSGRVGSSPAPAKPLTNPSTSKTPGNQPAGTTKAASIRAPSPLKKVRPGLGTRKSTMSVTIEQRLREMSLVHQMLHAAMAEEGDEDDDVKESYGKQMDEQLAALKARLEQAKMEENLVDSGPETDVQPTANGPSCPTIPADVNLLTTVDDPQVNATAHETDDSMHESHLKEQETITLEQLEEVDVSALDDVSPGELKVGMWQPSKSQDYEILQSSTHHETSKLRNAVNHWMVDLTSTQVTNENNEREVASLKTTNERLQAKVQELETSICALRDELEGVRGQKDRELNHAQGVIEGLQDSIRSLHETKERELHDVLSFAQKHEEAVSASEEMRNTHWTQQEELRAALASAHEDNVKLRYSLVRGEESLSLEIAKSNRLCADTEVFRQQIADLREEKDAAQASNAELQKELSEAAKSNQMHERKELVRQQIADLEKKNAPQPSSAELLKMLAETAQSSQLQTALACQNEEKKVEAQQELAATQGVLDDLRQKHQQLTAEHELELQTMRSLRQELERNRAEAQDTYENLELEHVTMQSQLDADARSVARDAIDQEITKLQIELEKAREAWAKLDSELEKAQAEAEQYKTKARELHSALKVTTAELVELRTERPSGSSYSGSPVPTAGLRSSRWAREDRNGEDGGEGALGDGNHEGIRQADAHHE
ncbi:MAG: hypothetical protein Q9208_006131 [Pyrenodesmia sp. 3 TL-2023]